jgi:hypothetical protein
MTNRHRTITVTLERDTRDDDLQHYLTVIRSIRGVAAAEPGPVVDYSAHEARHDLGMKYGRQLAELGYAMMRGKPVSITVPE